MLQNNQVLQIWFILSNLPLKEADFLSKYLSPLKYTILIDISCLLEINLEA